MNDPHRDEPVRRLGAPLDQAAAAVILLHGRGSSAEDILGLAAEMYDDRVAYLAPEAAGHRWYPYSFMAPIAENEPWLSSALAKVAATVQLALDAKVAREHIVICGFSQGACLATEFVARHPARYGAMIAFTGGLIGPADADLRHPGDLAGMPALFSSGDPDPHVPWSRVLASAEQFIAMGAKSRDTAPCRPSPHRASAGNRIRARASVARPVILSRCAWAFSHIKKGALVSEGTDCRSERSWSSPHFPSCCSCSVPSFLCQPKPIRRVARRCARPGTTRHGGEHSSPRQ